MKVYEFGKENSRTFVMFQCAVEPWWTFEASCKEMAKDYHVYLFMTDGHDEQGTDFVSIEKTVRDAGAYFREKGVERIDAMYGVSMGGAITARFLATEDIPVEKAIIDAGIMPYSYPRFICRLIALKDWAMIMLGTKSMFFMKLAAPPDKWTPEGEDPKEHYEKIFDFEKNMLSSKTIYNVFWSTNNFSMPEPVPEISTKMVYWYGEKEKKARKDDLAYVLKVFPKTGVREFPGLEHAELVLMHPKKFYEEATAFLDEE